jgi:endonuclease-3
MAVATDVKRRAAQVVRALARHYPDARCALDFRTPLELLVATILSAQCTDARVNLVTKDLFRKYHSAADYARAGLAVLESEIQSTGFYRNKAKNIKACCQAIQEEFDGEVPRDLDALVQLPGIGRKTANVVLGTAYGVPSGVVVDTHVGRESRRLGLTAYEEKDAVRIEQDLMALIPRKEWIDFSHRMIHHGRRICTARKPKCGVCPMNSFCPRIGLSEERPEGTGKR